MKHSSIKEDGPDKPPDRGAFKRRGSFTSTSSSWTYVKELFEIIRGRTRFFFDNSDHASHHISLQQVVTALTSAATKMAGNDGIGQLLITRAGMSFQRIELSIVLINNDCKLNFF